jgi:hypothetical protein
MEVPGKTTVSIFLKIGWNLLFVIFYPIITTFSLLFMGILMLFSGMSNVLSRLSTSKSSGIELKKPEWKPYVEYAGYSIEKIFVDDIMFGPSYNHLRSEPRLNCLENTFFGDFNYPCFNGVLLQKWNTTAFKDLPDFTLVFLDLNTGTLREIERIKSFSWNVVEDKSGQVKVKWFNGTEGGEVEINEQLLSREQIA